MTDDDGVGHIVYLLKKLPRIIGNAKIVSAFRGASVIKYSSFNITVFLHKFRDFTCFLSDVLHLQNVSSQVRCEASIYFVINSK